VYCRSPWTDAVATNTKDDSPSKEGYINLAQEQCISTTRDTSTYSKWRRGRYGRFDYDDDEEDGDDDDY
jgi:hypothetical protein